MPDQKIRWYVRLLDLSPPAFSILGGIGYLVLIQFPNRLDCGQNIIFNRISILTLAFLTAGVLCGIISMRFYMPNANRRVKDLLWLCLPAILLVTSFSTPSLLVKSVVSARDMCINNVRKIEAAKAEWVQRTGATSGAEINWNDITSYFTNGFPKCPEAGTYKVGNIGEEVTCSNPRHKTTP